MLKRVIIFLIMAVLVFSLLSRATPGPQMTTHMKYGIRMAEKNLFSARMLLKMKDETGLTAEQVAVIEKMHTAYKENRIKSDAGIKTLQLEFDTYLKEDAIDRAKLEKTIRKIAKLRTEAQVASINHLLDLREQLTAGQLTRLDELKKEMRHQRWQKRKDWKKDKTEKE